jgi:hypothetical protein
LPTDSAEMHVLRQLEKNYLSTGNSLQSQGNANRFACGKCLRCANADFAVPQIGQAAQAVSVEIDVPLYSGEGACELVLSSSYRTDVPMCAPIIAVGGPTSLKIL